MWSISVDKKIINIHNNDLYEIYNFGTLFLGHHYYILDLSDQCLGEKISVFRSARKYICKPVHFFILLNTVHKSINNFIFKHVSAKSIT